MRAAGDAVVRQVDRRAGRVRQAVLDRQRAPAGDDEEAGVDEDGHGDALVFDVLAVRERDGARAPLHRRVEALAAGAAARGARGLDRARERRAEDAQFPAVDAERVFPEAARVKEAAIARVDARRGGVEPRPPRARDARRAPVRGLPRADEREAREYVARDLRSPSPLGKRRRTPETDEVERARPVGE